MKKITLISGISLLSMSVFAGSLHKFDRSLSLNTDRLSGIEMDVGAGSLEIVGIAGNEIKVNATIESKDYSDIEDLMEAFEDKMEFSLTRDNGFALLKAKKADGLNWINNKNIAINLQIEVPKSMNLVIDDGSGPMTIENIDGSVKIDDGSGPITLRMIGDDVHIDDGSGSIHVAQINGNLDIDDGSGEVVLKKINGSVDIKDGSGEINAKEIAGDFKVDDGSGSIIVKDLEGDFKLIDDGSGSVRVNGKSWGRK
ncbi:MAG: hypothetical protein KDI92_11415 [Xanthomonadales bacterium]|nr:hypothetical protein [Xanthomonadales bacterium]